MKKMKVKNAYEMELVALIKSGVSPEEAKRIADSHIGNADNLAEQITKERNDERQQDKHQRAYARVLSARIKAGEKPSDVVEDMQDFEM